MTLFVGNDVVDLGRSRTRGRASDERFVGRVFDDEEEAAIRAAPDPDFEVWARWAAKEAAFKIVSKLAAGPPPFVHRAFRVRWAERSGTTPPGGIQPVRRGVVDHPSGEAHVWIVAREEYVHAVGYGSDAGESPGMRLHPGVASLDDTDARWSRPLEDLRDHFTPRELDAIHSRPSAAVRLAARDDLSRVFGVEERRLEIVCDPGQASRRPPRVMLDGTPARADVSLSHDGRWIAWVLWAPNPSEDNT